MANLIFLYRCPAEIESNGLVAHLNPAIPPFPQSPLSFVVTLNNGFADGVGLMSFKLTLCHIFIDSRDSGNPKNDNDWECIIEMPA